MANDTPSWNIVNVRQLRKSIRLAEPKPNQKQSIHRQRLKDIIAQWWQAEAQAKAREGSTTARESKAEQFRLMADMGNADWINQVRAARGQEPMHVKYLDDAVSQAGGDPTAREGLRQWALSEVEQGRSASLEVQRVLFSGAPKGKKGNASRKRDRNQQQQVYAIVEALIDGTRFKPKTTAKIDSDDPDSPFVIAAQAINITPRAAYDNWHKCRKAFED